MAKSPKTNTRWSKADRSKLMQLVATYSKPTLGFNEIATAMGRTPAAVSWQYYNSVKKYKKRPITTIVKPSNRVLEIDIKNITINNNKLIIEF